MWNDKLFLTTRGKVLRLLKKHGSCTVGFLSQQLGLSSNAIRQHLSALERDNLLTQHPVKNGPSRPASVFSLTPEAESLFPKRYESLAIGLIHEMASHEGGTRTGNWLAQVGASAAEEYLDRVAHLSMEEKLAEVRGIMEERDSIAGWSQAELGVTIQDYNCPYAAVAQRHPEVCQVQRSFLQRLLRPATVDITCDPEESRCGFLITPG